MYAMHAKLFAKNVNAKNKGMNTSLMFAAKSGYLNVANLLIQAGASVNTISSDGFSALIYSTLNNHKEILKLLVKHGADINIKINTKYILQSITYTIYIITIMILFII